MLKQSESFMVGYDVSDDGTEKVLTVSSMIKGKYFINSVYFGNEAEKLYFVLKGDVENE